MTQPSLPETTDPALEELAELRRQILAHWEPYTGPTMSEADCDHLVTAKINERTRECSGCGRTYPIDGKRRHRRQ